MDRKQPTKECYTAKAVFIATRQPYCRATFMKGNQPRLHIMKNRWGTYAVTNCKTGKITVVKEKAVKRICR